MSLTAHTSSGASEIGRVHWPAPPVPPELRFLDTADKSALKQWMVQVNQWMAQVNQSVDRALLEIVTEVRKQQQTK